MIKKDEKCNRLKKNLQTYDENELISSRKYFTIITLYFNFTVDNLQNYL